MLILSHFLPVQPLHPQLRHAILLCVYTTPESSFFAAEILSQTDGETLQYRREADVDDYFFFKLPCRATAQRSKAVISGIGFLAGKKLKYLPFHTFSH